MNKIIIFAALAAALTLSSCRKEESKNYDPDTLRTVHFTTSPYITKTVFGEKNSANKYPVLWQDGDKVCPSLNFAKPESENYIEVTPTSDTYESAEFSGEFPTAASYRFLFVSPAAAFKSANGTNKTIMVEFPAGQTSTEESPDPAAQILFADTGEITEITDPVNLEFDHLSAYLHITINGIATETYEVQAVNITNEDRFLAGRIFYNLENDSFEASTEFNTISVATTTLTDVWCSVCPVDLSGGQLTIVVSTDKGTFTKTVNMPASADLTRGKVAKFTVNMEGVEPATPVVYKAVTNTNQLNVGDKVIIAAADIDQAYAMSTGQNTNNRSAAGVSKTADEIVNPTEAVEIFELEDGIIPGHFAFKATRTPGYIYAANTESSGSNILRTKNTLDNSASWDITIGNVTAGGKTWNNASIIFADIPSSGRGLIRFNSNDKLFTAYGPGSTQQAVKLYRLDEPASPHFKAALPDGKDYITYKGQEVQVYVFGNVGWTASVTGEGASLDEISGTGNTVLTLTVPQNNSTEYTKAYTVTVTTTAEVATKSYTLNITQGKGGLAYYFFLASAGNNLGSNGTYAGNCDILINGVTWNVTGVSNSGSYAGWRLGGKSLTEVNRVIYSKTAIPENISKVVVSHSRTSITINSFTLTVHGTAEDAATGANPIATLTANEVEAGTQDKPKPCTFQKENDTSWAECFYRLAYNVTATGSSDNKYLEFRGVELWE